MVLNLGDWEYGSEKYLRSVKKNTGGGTAIARGKVVRRNDTNDRYDIAATTATAGEFGVCTHTNLDGDAEFGAMIGGGTVVVTADGAIDPYADVMPSGATAGEVIAYVKSTIGGTYAQAEVQAARDEHDLIIGKYIGKEGEGDGGLTGSALTAAQDGDKIKIALKSRTGGR